MGINYQNDDGIVTLTMNIGDKPVNTMGAEMAASLAEVIPRLEQEQDLKGVILTSAKQDFMSGGDLNMLYSLSTPEEVIEGSGNIKTMLRRLETLGKPVVACINGHALGGGLETALCCHFRICLDAKNIKIGLPETTLGLFPGGGGTQRLPRIIGIQPALPVILEGKPMNPQKAKGLGIVDELAADVDEMRTKALIFIKDNPESAQPWDKKGFKWPGGAPNGPKLGSVWMMSGPMLAQKTRDNYPGQRNALSAVYEGAMVDFDTADRIESRYFAKTVVSPEAKNMIGTFWFQLNALNKGKSRPADIPRGKVSKVGVLGAGMMGAGIAYAYAMRGIPVVLKDITDEAAERGKDYSRMLLEKRVKRGRMNQAKADGVLELIKTTSNPADVEGCDLVIEAVFEDRNLKAKVTQESEAVMTDNAIYASNTSTLPITGLAEASARPANFIGLHFFSPVDKMQLVEIIVGKETSDETLARSFDYVQQIGKVPIVVNDSRGFYTSRVFSTYVNEGMALLAEGQDPRKIEAAGLQAGMPVGPLAVSDEVSMSLMHHIRTQTKKDLGDAYQESPADPVIEAMVSKLDRPGKKAGKGFYAYPEKAPKHIWPGLMDAFPKAESEQSQSHMIDRMMFVQSIETIRCMEEGVVKTKIDADIGSIFGWGFAPFQGGTLQMVNAYGLDAFIERANQLADQHGERFRPPQLLLDKAAAGETF